MMNEKGICTQAIQITNDWLTSLMNDTGWKDKRKAFIALHAVLYSLRDHLSLYDAAEFGIQLPVLLRILYYEDWDWYVKNKKYRRKKDFLATVQEQCGNAIDAGPELVARMVLRFLAERMSAGEIKDIRSALPEHLQYLWDEPKVLSIA